MKKITILIALILGFTSNAQYYQNKRESANREIETLEKLDRMMENDKSNELKAKQIVLSYNYELKNKIREYKIELSDEDYKYLLNYQELLWSSVYAKKQYYNSFKKFYEENFENLENYKDKVIEKLYQYLK